MRTLKFIVDKQTLMVDPNCDFSDLVPGTEGYLKAEFAFSSEWRGLVKAVGFYSLMGTEYEPKILDKSAACIIPAEALKRRVFKIQVLGRDVNGLALKTNRLTIRQNGGNA